MMSAINFVAVLTLASTKKKQKFFIKVVSRVVNTNLATDIQDDAELNIDTIYLTAYKVSTTIDSRNFMTNVESLIKLVDAND